jgi:predicted regulator of Ras-like GTPase activity (Roadblock/LC7/MglB family)
VNTPFAQILRDAVEKTPGAIGGAFAASDGELVDSFTPQDPTEWAIMTAHYGILMSHVQRALLTFHYGHAEVVVLSHEAVDVVLQNVSEGYYCLLAASHPVPLARAFANLEVAAAALREEMG